MDNPLDVTAFLSRPCATLTQTQLSELAITRPGSPTTSGGIADEVGPFCTWLTPEQSGATTVAFLTNNTSGLATAYESRDEFRYFEPTTVNGYPAVFADYTDLRNDGDCNIIVGVSEKATFRADESGRLDAQQSCDRAKQVAAAALTTMGGT